MFKPFLSPLAPNIFAPVFGRMNQHSQTVYSEQLLKQGGYLLHFYFAPWSATSKRSLLALKNLTPVLQEKQITVLASNPYDWQIQHQLAKELELPFSLLYDPISKTAKAYKAVLLNTFFNHEVTYFVSSDGRIAHIETGPVNEKSLLDKILAKV
jgi:peroxiredoxin